MNINTDILTQFKKMTGTNIEEFFKDCLSFFTNDAPKIVAFYSGAQPIIAKNIFDNLSKIEKDCEKIFAAFHQASERMNNAIWWETLELVEEIDSRLKTLRNINKWSRSSLKGVSYSPSHQVTYITKQSQTLERVALDILGSNDSEEWSQIATSNNLREEDYTLDGGTEVSLNFDNINKGTDIESVVAVMIGKAIYGLDIYSRIQFDNEEGDLVVLGYEETILQSANILIALKKNDNPDFPNDGLQREVVVGGSRASMNFPIVQRQLGSTFETDDSLKNFIVKSLVFNEDNLSIDFQVHTRLDEVLINTTLV